MGTGMGGRSERRRHGQSQRKEHQLTLRVRDHGQTQHRHTIFISNRGKHEHVQRPGNANVAQSDWARMLIDWSVICWASHALKFNGRKPQATCATVHSIYSHLDIRPHVKKLLRDRVTPTSKLCSPGGNSVSYSLWGTHHAKSPENDNQVNRPQFTVPLPDPWTSAQLHSRTGQA